MWLQIDQWLKKGIKDKHRCVNLNTSEHVLDHYAPTFYLAYYVESNY